MGGGRVQPWGTEVLSTVAMRSGVQDQLADTQEGSSRLCLEKPQEQPGERGEPDCGCQPGEASAELVRAVHRLGTGPERWMWGWSVRPAWALLC